MAEYDKPLFQTALTVQVGDVNYGGHLANDAVLRLCHEVRMRWLAKLGWSEMDAGGAGLIMADAAVQYLAQGHHGDELSVEMGAAGVAGVGFFFTVPYSAGFQTVLCWRKYRQAWCVSIMASSVSAVCLRH